MLKIESDLRNAINNRLDDDEKTRLCIYVFDSLETQSKDIVFDYTADWTFVRNFGTEKTKGISNIKETK